MTSKNRSGVPWEPITLLRHPVSDMGLLTNIEILETCHAFASVSICPEIHQTCCSVPPVMVVRLLIVTWVPWNPSTWLHHPVSVVTWVPYNPQPYCVILSVTLRGYPATHRPCCTILSVTLRGCPSTHQPCCAILSVTLSGCPEILLLRESQTVSQPASHPVSWSVGQ